ncbi:MAG TPA: hypothetical protein VKA21_06315 [Candidatus Binatia bacterium]|nr:hypothetical protein [Candidatus Binatia bacterium]
MATAVGLTLLLVLAGHALAHALGVRGLAARLLFAATCAAAAIVGIETVLGATGTLGRRPVIALAIAFAMGTLGGSLARLRGRIGSALAADVAALRAAVAAARYPEIVVLGVVAAIAWAWVVAAVAYLPPRSVDDLCHHLPPIFEAIVRGRFVVLPLELRLWFAYPLAGDLLPLWPTLLAGDVRWTDGAQIGTALLAAVASVAIARELGASRRSALVGALVFLLMPITLKQASSSYTDVTLAAAYGAAVWGATRHLRDGGIAPLVLSGVGIGLVAGMRYHFLFPALALAALVGVGLRRHAPSRSAAVGRLVVGFVAPALALGGYWYARNLVQLGNPFFPYRLGVGPLTVFPSAIPAGHSAATPSFASLLVQHPLVPFAISLRDVGVGGIDGGFGPLFWGAVLPLAAIHAARGRRGETGALRLAVAVAVLAGLVPYLVAWGALFEVTGRYFLAPAVPGVALLALSLDAVRRRWPGPARVAVAATVAAVVLAVVPIADGGGEHARKQLTRFGPAAGAARDGAFASPWRFIANASYGVGRVAPAWDLLDLVSAPPDAPVRPLWVYATGAYPAGFYGTRLQNRLWNLDGPGRPAEPDVLVYYFESPRPESVAYYGLPADRWETVTAEPDRFDVVLIGEGMAVAFRRDLLARDADLRARIVAYLEHVHGDEVQLAAGFERRVATGTIVAAPGIALGLKTLELRGEIAAHVIPARREDLARYLPDARARRPVLVAARSGQAIGPVVAEAHGFALYALDGAAR